MTFPILNTKLFIPPIRTDLLSRPKLMEKLNESATYPLTLISASAGSGKTTILSEWVANHDHQVAWISLDQGDNDPVTFLIYFISALKTIQAKFGDEALESLQSSQTAPFEIILINLVNEIAGYPKQFTLILDDFHTITDQQTNEIVSFMVDHLPPQMHLIIASRIDPPWPLARYRARNQILEIRGRDLRFNAEEAAEFLNSLKRLNLSVEHVKALEERTEGWVAGLQLAALSMQGHTNIPEFIEAFTGSNLYVADYLVEEILMQQPDEMQSFMLRTSLLDHLSAGLCEAVTGSEDGQATLTALHQANVFVIPLDHEGQWFRYHHLFADLLRSRLPQALPAEMIPELHRRASLWYEQNGFAHEAVNHALAAKDFERVADLVKQAAHRLIYSGRVNTIRSWLEALPDASIRDHPQLTFYLFWIDVLQNRADLSESAIQEMQDRLKELPSSPENDRLRGELMAVTCRAITLSGRTSEGIHLAQDALASLPIDELASRARVYSALATAHDLEGRPEKTELYYRESISQALTAGDYRLAAHTAMAQGLIQCQYGRLFAASRSFQSIIDMADRANLGLEGTTGVAVATNTRANKVFFPAGQGYIGLASIHLEWNDLQTAENYLEQGMDLCRRGGLDGIFIGRMQMSRLRQAKGDLEGAQKEIMFPEQAQRADDFNIATRHIQIALAKGDIDSAWRWAAPFAELVNHDPTTIRLPLVFSEVLEAMIARVYLAQGEIRNALQLLDRLQTTAEPSNRAGRLIEVHLLRARAYQKQSRGNPTPNAIESIERALALGEPEGYILLFLEEGLALIPLLNAVIARQATPDRLKKYAQTLLDAFSDIGITATAQITPEANGLVEQLTLREIEVLELLASGDSNQTIADKLVITVRTVKKHTSNIYGKLNASSRTQAVARARELGLLSTE